MVRNPENQNHGEDAVFTEEERRLMHDKLMANPNKKSLTKKETKKVIEIAKIAEKEKAQPKIEFPRKAKNYYEVLGVAKDATPKQIKDTFKRFNDAHYDKEKTTEEERRKYREEFRDKNEAYEVLYNPEWRETYDIWLREQAEEQARLDKEKIDQKLADAFKEDQETQKELDRDYEKKYEDEFLGEQEPQALPTPEAARMEAQAPPAPEATRLRRAWGGLWGIGRFGLTTAGAVAAEAAVSLWRGGVLFAKTMRDEFWKLGGEFSELFQAAKDAYKKISGREESGREK